MHRNRSGISTERGQGSGCCRRLARLLLCGAAIAVIATGVQAAEASHGFQITAAEADRAILAAHPELAGAAVELPARIEARRSDPLLHAGPLLPETIFPTAGSAPAALTRVRLACEAESVCLPFYVTVHLSAAQAAGLQSLSQPYGRQARGEKMRAAAPALRAGEHAFLLMDSGPIHIRIPVTCLQSGAIGSVIRVESVTRVTGTTRRETFTAAVVDRSTVRGNL